MRKSNQINQEPHASQEPNQNDIPSHRYREKAKRRPIIGGQQGRNSQLIFYRLFVHHNQEAKPTIHSAHPEHQETKTLLQEEAVVPGRGSGQRSQQASRK